jgi:ubiquinone/menaquinone biosynthesis C-methylase UbiE
MSESSPDIARGFRDVDAEPDAQPFRDYLRRVSEQMAAEKVANHRLLEPSPGRRLLDVGCGTGGDVRALAELVAPTGLVVGVDRSDTFVQEARAVSAGSCAEFVAADAAALPFEAESFDGARVERTLQHVEDPAVVLGEMKRVVRSGGILVAAEPDWGTLAIDGADAATTQTVCDTLCRHHIRNGWIGRQLAGHFARIGLTAIEVQPVTLVVRSFPIAADMFGLAQAGSDPWLAELQNSHAHGTFFASMTGFTVTGRTPG